MPHPMLKEMASLVNETLGEHCTYKTYDGTEIQTAVTFDKNNKVYNDFGVLQGYNVLVSVLKADVPQFDNGDLIVEPDGKEWRIDSMVKETTAKWYFLVTGY